LLRHQQGFLHLARAAIVLGVISAELATNDFSRLESVNASLLWQMVKLKVREQTLRYAKTKKAKVLREEELEKKLTHCRGKLIQGVTTPKKS